MKNHKRLFAIALLLLPVLCVPVLAQATGDVGICTTLNNVKRVLTGISVVVVTLAVMWAGYKFLFTRAEITECGKILAAGVMIGSATTIASWFMGTDTCNDEVLQSSIFRCDVPANTIAMTPVYLDTVIRS